MSLGEVKIGLLLPTTGVDAAQGTDTTRGFELYLKKLGILPAIGDAALGIITVGAYSAALETQVNKQFVRDYDTAYKSWPSRYSECGWDAAALIGTALDTLNGDVSDRSAVRDALKSALPKIQPPRGPMQFDAYRQAISPIYITRTEKQAGRIVNVVIDRIPAVSQEATWGWWNRSSSV